MKACAPAIHKATQEVMPIRRFKGSAGSRFYRQCAKCKRKVGRNLDPLNLPGDVHPGMVKWAERLPKRSGNSRRRQYSAYIRSVAWRRKRAQRLEMDNWTCGCGEPADQVHHLNYDRFGGQERMGDLRSLCFPCHESEHSEKRGET